MIHDEAAHCCERIAEEERRATHATNSEARARHEQAAMLYRAQLVILHRKVFVKAA